MLEDPRARRPRDPPFSNQKFFTFCKKDGPHLSQPQITTFPLGNPSRHQLGLDILRDVHGRGQTLLPRLKLFACDTDFVRVTDGRDPYGRIIASNVCLAHVIVCRGSDTQESQIVAINEVKTPVYSLRKTCSSADRISDESRGKVNSHAVMSYAVCVVVYRVLLLHVSGSDCSQSCLFVALVCFVCDCFSLLVNLLFESIEYVLLIWHLALPSCF